MYILSFETCSSRSSVLFVVCSWAGVFDDKAALVTDTMCFHLCALWSAGRVFTT